MRAACSSKIRITGLISIPPKFGSRLRIGRSAGSVMRYRKSPIVQTTRLRVSSTLNETNMLNTAAKITAHVYRLIRRSSSQNNAAMYSAPPRKAAGP
jgi:hypothetical protein